MKLNPELIDRLPAVDLEITVKKDARIIASCILGHGVRYDHHLYGIINKTVEGHSLSIRGKNKDKHLIEGIFKSLAELKPLLVTNETHTQETIFRTIRDLTERFTTKHNAYDSALLRLFKETIKSALSYLPCVCKVDWLQMVSIGFTDEGLQLLLSVEDYYMTIILSENSRYFISNVKTNN